MPLASTSPHSSLCSPYDRALSLPEALDRIPTGAVGDVDGRADLDVVGQGDVLDLDTVVYNYDEYMGQYTS